jgi:carboxymethylenebutenolidase
VKEHLSSIPTASGTMDTFVTYPSACGPFPAVIIYMDVWGVREELFDIARRVATVGYCCLVPDFYYRQGKIRNEYRNDKNQMITLDHLDEKKRERVLAPLKHLTDEMVIEDTGCVLKFMDAEQSVRRGGPLGCIGYCMGGRHVFRVAGRYPGRFKASVSLHGTDLVTHSADSAHIAAAKAARGELYCGFGAKDRHTPAAVVEVLERAFASSAVRYKYAVHDGADHGYALPDRDVYDKHGANRDWEVIFAMFHRQLRPTQQVEIESGQKVP